MRRLKHIAATTPKPGIAPSHTTHCCPGRGRKASICRCVRWPA